MLVDAPNDDSCTFKSRPRAVALDILTLVTKGRVARHHSQPRQLRQAVDETLSDSFGEEFEVRIASQIVERQDYDRVKLSALRIVV